MNTFSLQIVSFNKALVDEQAAYCAVETATGKIGFKAHHEPFVSVLQNDSEIEYQIASKGVQKVKIQNGLFSFIDNKCSITIF